MKVSTSLHKQEIINAVKERKEKEEQMAWKIETEV